ncbi:pseudouridine synthase [Dyadobacter sandarakinus]|uniref:Pseudouridine synthase n=1 Tax=Dyadobacter sandarakinus TaxID=2747268 RepID=A0ABX7I9V2_9BACT|nr:pseudouridine synthase [Dyadobacter sandarakinus]QRR02714.1 pseudouridine synthase [Dyadobacter sandarakinus]
MKKRTTSPKAGNNAQSASGASRSFQKSSGGTGGDRPFKRAKSEVESRFSKPSIKKSSLRFSKTENTGQKARPDFSHEKPESFKPRSFRDREEFTSEGKKPFSKPERPFSKTDKPFSKADRPFSKTDKPFSKSDKPFSKSDKPFSKSDKPFPRTEAPFSKSEKPSFRESGRSKGFGKPERESERPFGFKQKENSGFKKKDDSEPRDHAAPQSGSAEPEADQSGLERRVGRYKSAPGYDLSGYEKRTGKKVKEDPSDIRLNRYIANAGICSRREADDLIASGQISVNGKTVTEMGYKVKLSDVVKYGKRALNPEKMVYILINKPKDYITTTDDPEERRTVLDLIKGACDERVYPVGRLDRNTTGLLLLTNDGELAGKLTHPSTGIGKIYQAELDRPIATEDFEKLQQGVALEDGFIRPDEVGIVTPDAMVVGLEIHSGRNRVVRRIFEHLGYEVKKLDRTVFAGLNKKDLPRGKWRFLTEREVIKLKYML